MPDNQDQVLTALAQMMNKVDQRFDQVTNYVKEVHNDVMTKMDAVYKEVQDMRQEQSAHQAQHKEINTRLDVIEATPAVTHELRNK